MTDSERDELLLGEVRARLPGLGYPIDEKVLERALNYCGDKNSDEQNSEAREQYGRWLQETQSSFRNTVDENTKHSTVIALINSLAQPFLLGYLNEDNRELHEGKLQELIEDGHDDLGFPDMQHINLQIHEEKLRDCADPRELTLEIINMISVPSVYRFFQRITGEYKRPWRDDVSLLYKPFFEVKESQENLCREIYIEPVGLEMIKPYSTGDDPHSDYLYEAVHGAIVARITVYSLTFVPETPEAKDALAERLSRSLQELEKMKPTFENNMSGSIGTESYRRLNTFWISKEKRFGNYYYIKDDNGRLVVSAHLDLDDVCRLYKLCRSFTKPNPQIAAAVNGARYAEERGPIEWLDDLADEIEYEYDYYSGGRQEALGNLRDSAKENLLRDALLHIVSLHGLGLASKEEMAINIASVADATLRGTISDPMEVLQPYQKLLADSTGGNSIISYEDALRQRIKLLFNMVSSGLSGPENKNTAPAEKFTAASKNAGDIAEFELKVNRLIDWYRFEYGNANVKRTKSDIREEESDQEDDTISGEQALVTNRDIKRRGKTMPFILDRSYPGTTYTSRSKISLNPRIELPEDLAPFINQDNDFNPRKLLAEMNLET